MLWENTAGPQVASGAPLVVEGESAPRDCPSTGCGRSLSRRPEMDTAETGRVPVSRLTRCLSCALRISSVGLVVLLSVLACGAIVLHAASYGRKVEREFTVGSWSLSISVGIPPDTSIVGTPSWTEPPEHVQALVFLWAKYGHCHVSYDPLGIQAPVGPGGSWKWGGLSFEDERLPYGMGCLRFLELGMPLPVVWVGFGLVPCAHVIRLAVRRYRRRYRATHALCIRCGYSLVGKVSGRCPECGHPCSIEGVNAARSG